MSRFDEIISETKTIIYELLENQDKRPWYLSERQLNSIISELDKMNEVRDVNIYYPYYPRGIADSWDSNDELGRKLLEVLSIYKKL